MVILSNIIGGAIEAGLFVGSGGALYKGGLVITRNLAQFG